MSDTQIQFISAEELRKLAEMEKEERKRGSVEGMIEHMDEVHASLDKDMQAEFGPDMSLMKAWAIEHPGEFFKLQARLKLAKKDEQRLTRIQIGLPMTSLDALPEDVE